MLLIDENQVYIKDYEEIIHFDEYMFDIQMKKYRLLVKGEKMELFYYDHHEIRINGKVKVIEYHDNRV